MLDALEASAFLDALEVLRGVVSGERPPETLTEGQELLRHLRALRLRVRDKISMVGQHVLLHQRHTLNSITYTELHDVARRARQLAGIDRRTMAPARKKEKEDALRKRLGVPSEAGLRHVMVGFFDALKESKKRSAKAVFQEAATGVLECAEGASAANAVQAIFARAARYDDGPGI